MGSQTIGIIQWICVDFSIVISAAGIFKIIKILIEGQSDGTPVADSLKRVKRILGGIILCICITSIVSIMRKYYLG